MRRLGLVLFLALVLVFPACTTTAKAPLKIGVIPMMNVLPLYVADQEALFKKEGVDVQIVPFNAVIDRDTALAAGQIDGIIEDIYSAPLLDKDAPVVKVVAVSPVDGPMFYIVGSPQSKANSVADLKGSSVALSLNTIVEYALDSMVVAGGLHASDVNKVSVPSMPLRLEMLNAGKVDAAVFSRPLSDVALANGAKMIANDGAAPVSDSSIMFSTASLKSRPDDVKKFLKAWSAAVDDIRADPQKYRPLLVQIGQVPDQLAASIDVPNFATPRMPTVDEYQPKVNWLVKKGILSKPVAFQDVVASGYLP